MCTLGQKAISDFSMNFIEFLLRKTDLFLRNLERYSYILKSKCIVEQRVNNSFLSRSRDGNGQFVGQATVQINIFNLTLF